MTLKVRVPSVGVAAPVYMCMDVVHMSRALQEALNRGAPEGGRGGVLSPSEYQVIQKQSLSKPSKLINSAIFLSNALLSQFSANEFETESLRTFNFKIGHLM